MFIIPLTSEEDIAKHRTHCYKTNIATKLRSACKCQPALTLWCFKRCYLATTYNINYVFSNINSAICKRWSIRNTFTYNKCLLTCLVLGLTSPVLLFGHLYWTVVFFQLDETKKKNFNLVKNIRRFRWQKISFNHF